MDIFVFLLLAGACGDLGESRDSATAPIVDADAAPVPNLMPAPLPTRTPQNPNHVPADAVPTLPRVLVLLTDDQRYNTVHALGNSLGHIAGQALVRARGRTRVGVTVCCWLRGKHQPELSATTRS